MSVKAKKLAHLEKINGSERLANILPVLMLASRKELLRWPTALLVF